MRMVHRYTTKGEGIFSAGKRLLADAFAKSIINLEEVLKAKEWLPKPKLPKGDYIFYLTEKGKKMYENSLLKLHKKYLEEIKCEIIEKEKIKNIIYEDEYQVVEKLE